MFNSLSATKRECRIGSKTGSAKPTLKGECLLTLDNKLLLNVHTNLVSIFRTPQ